MTLIVDKKNVLVALFNDGTLNSLVAICNKINHGRVTLFESGEIHIDMPDLENETYAIPKNYFVLLELTDFDSKGTQEYVIKSVVDDLNKQYTTIG